jgi:hypothetical protein
MQHLLDNFMTYESQLVRINGVQFEAGTFGTGSAGNINIHQGQSQMICRNHWGALTGYTTDPVNLYDVVGFTIPYNAERQIAPRELSDIIPHVPGHVIKATAGTGGIIDPQGDVFVIEGENQTFTITPNDGYEIEDVLVDGASVGKVETYTFDNVEAPHTISVTFFTELDVVAKPVFSPAGGPYYNVIDVVISCETEGAEIFYTTNGIEPTQSDTKYTEPITLDAGNHTLKAKAFKTDFLPSETATETYIIILSINEKDLYKLISVYPNPTTGELRITNYELRITDIEVFDIYGRKQRHVSRVTRHDCHEIIDISGLSAGIYFVKIKTDAGEVVKKVVKQ